MKITEELFEHLRTLVHAELSEDGSELLNPEPLVVYSDLERPLTLQEQIQRCLRSDVSLQASMQGFESYDESQDFDIEDDFDTPAVDTVYTVLEEELAHTDPSLIGVDPEPLPQDQPEDQPTDPPADPVDTIE